jgi:Insect cuticle protein
VSLQFVALFAFAAVASAHSIPSSYHTVSLHPVSYVKHEAKPEPWVEKPKAEWSEPQGWEHKGWEHKEPEAPANYDFKYEVHDEHTGDIKRQSETAVNGAVKGQYSLIDSDGYRRVVEYTADDHHGFQAVVKREPTHFKVPQPAPKAEEPAWW